MGTRHWPSKTIVRATAGLALLLWLALPVCLLVALWAGDWRWAATGITAFATGCAVGAMVVGPGRRGGVRRG